MSKLEFASSAKKYFLAIDQGTSSSRAILYDSSLNEISKSQIEFKQYYPRKGWVEHDPEEIYLSERTAIKNVLTELKDTEVEIFAGITNQRETIVVWDTKTSKPVYNAIVWQDCRTADYCQKLKLDSELPEFIRGKTGLLIDTYFSATKLKWILDSEPSLRKKAATGEILCGTIDSWLMWKLSNGMVHQTDYTNASRTLLFNIHELSWDNELLKIFNIPDLILPKAMPSQADFCDFKIDGFNIKVKAVAGDQSASLFGHTCFKQGEAKCTFGTGAFFLLNTGTETRTKVYEDSKKIENKVKRQALLRTIAFSLASGETYYALEGSIFIAGSGVNWLKNSMNLFSSISEIEPLIESISEESMEGLYLVPAFTGLGAPYWDMNARAAVLGMSLDTTKAHFLRAMLEAVAYQVRDLLALLSSKDLVLNVDGGLAASRFFMNFMSAILDAQVKRNQNLELTALGIVMMAANALGDYSLEELRKFHEAKLESFTEKYPANKIERLYGGWLKAIETVKSYAITASESASLMQRNGNLL